MTAIRRYWRLSLLLAVIAAAIFIFIVHDNSEAKQKIKPVPHKSMYQVTLFQENSFPVHEKMKQGIIAALESKGYTEKKNIHLEIIKSGFSCTIFFACVSICMRFPWPLIISRWIFFFSVNPLDSKAAMIPCFIFSCTGKEFS